MDRIVAVVDTVEHFALNFCTYANDEGLLPYPLMAFTQTEAFLESMKEHEPVLILIAEDMKALLDDLTCECPILFLTDAITDQEGHFVSRYQGADRILKEILLQLDANLLRKENLPVRMTGFYSPVGGSYQTSLALAYAGEASAGRRVLYVSLEEYAAMDAFVTDEGKDLSQALFCFLSGAEELQAKLLACMEKSTGPDLLLPGRCPEDLPELTEDELLRFMDYLKELGCYDELVVDVGHLLKKPWIFLNQCDRVLMPVREADPVGDRKREAFFYYLEHSNYAGLKKRIASVRLRESESLKGQPIGSLQLGSKELRESLREYCL